MYFGIRVIRMRVVMVRNVMRESILVERNCDGIFGGV